MKKNEFNLRNSMNSEHETINFCMSRVIVKNYRGIGIQWDPYIEYPMDDLQWNRLVTIIEYLKPSFIRCMIYSNFYCTGTDENNNPVYDFNNTKYMKQLYKILDFCEYKNIEVILGEWEDPSVVFDSGYLSGVYCDNPLWSEMIGNLLEHLMNERKYTCIKYFNYINEPNGDWSHCEDYEKWKTGIRFLFKELCSRKLNGKIKLTGPDTAWNLEWIDYTVEDLSEIIDMYDFHWYPENEEVINGDMETKFRPKREMIDNQDPNGKTKAFVMTEAGMVTGKTNGDQQPNVKVFSYGVNMADLAAQTMRAGICGICGWSLDDAMHLNGGFNGNSSKNVPYPPNEFSLKVWGLYNSYGEKMGNPEDQQLRPWFYTWSLISRLFPKGCDIIYSEASDATGLRTVAAKVHNSSNTKLSFMLINNASEERSITVKVPNLDFRGNLEQFNFFEIDMLSDINGFPVVKKTSENIDLEEGYEVIFTGRGVVFLSFN